MMLINHGQVDLMLGCQATGGEKQAQEQQSLWRGLSGGGSLSAFASVSPPVSPSTTFSFSLYVALWSMGLHNVGKTLTPNAACDVSPCCLTQTLNILIAKYVKMLIFSTFKGEIFPLANSIILCHSLILCPPFLSNLLILRRILSPNTPHFWFLFSWL